MRQTGSYRVIFRQDLCFGRFRNGVLSTMSDSTGPLDQSEGMTRQSIELPRVALARGLLQCIDSSAAKLVRILWFFGTTRSVIAADRVIAS